MHATHVWSIPLSNMSLKSGKRLQLPKRLSVDLGSEKNVGISQVDSSDRYSLESNGI